MNRSFFDQKGSTLVLFAFLITVLIAFVGLAIDGGYLFVQKARLQSTADAAVLACITESSSCGSGGSNLYPAVNPYDFDVVTTNPVTCPKSSQAGCAMAVASTSWKTFFLGVVGKVDVTLSARAIAGRNSGGPACVVDMTSFSTNGNNNVVLNNCSAAIGGAFNTTNKSGIVISPNTNENGITIYNGNSTACTKCSPAPIAVSTPIPALPTYNAPTLSAAPAPSYNAATKTYTYAPGSYSSAVTFDKKYSYVLSSGSYVFNGGFNTGSAVVTNSAGGVSLYVPGDKTLVLSGTVTLYAPTPANCAASSAVVISHPYTSTHYNMTVNGSFDHLSLTGIANLAADNLTIDGTSSALTITGSLLTNALTLNGNMNPSYSANPCNNLYPAGSVSLVQ
jgi:Flp pilus assembly protein TadG